MSSSLSDDWLADDASEDFDLQMARRDREISEEAIQNQALRQALEETAGEAYLAVYLDSFSRTIESFTRKWSIPCPEG